MKLNARDARAYFARPDPDRAGLLIAGADGVRVAEARRDVIANLLGPAAEEEMRLARLPAADLRRDPAALQTAMQSAGFFPGPRAVLVEEATDGLADILADALESHRPGDGSVIATAGALAARSKLRKLFEGHRSAACAVLYDDPPGRAEIAALAAAAGAELAEGGMAAMEEMARHAAPGALRGTIEKLALYMHGRGPAEADDVAAVAPPAAAADLDALAAAAADGDAGALGPLLARLGAQGTNAVSLIIGTTRHFRTLHAAAAMGTGGLRPPLFGPRKAMVERQARAWGVPRLEEALSILTRTDLQLRSAGQHAPAMPLAERALVRIAMLARR